MSGSQKPKPSYKYREVPTPTTSYLNSKQYVTQTILFKHFTCTIHE